MYRRLETPIHPHFASPKEALEGSTAMPLNPSERFPPLHTIKASPTTWDTDCKLLVAQDYTHDASTLKLHVKELRVVRRCRLPTNVS
jgi:hypothetical protein